MLRSFSWRSPGRRSSPNYIRCSASSPLLGECSFSYLAWESLGHVRRDAGAPAEQPRSWFKGIVTNLLNPHPWVFWLTVGTAILAKALAQSRLVAATFLIGFYLLLVGSKVMVALLAGRYGDLLAGRGYRVAMRVLAVMLALFALLLFREGLRHLTASR